MNLRTLQEYDSRAMDINRATGGTLLALSKALGCQVEDLLEYDYAEVIEGQRQRVICKNKELRKQNHPLY